MMPYFTFTFHSISMMDIAGGIDEELQNFIPNTCSNSPAPGLNFVRYSTLTDCINTGHAFCTSHCGDVKAMGYPTELKPFFKTCGNSVSPVNPEQYTKDMMKHVNETIKKISKDLQSKNVGVRSATDAQGKQFKCLMFIYVCKTLAQYL